MFSVAREKMRVIKKEGWWRKQWVWRKGMRTRALLCTLFRRLLCCFPLLLRAQGAAAFA